MDTKETSETVQKQFVAVLERLQNELKKEPADIAYVMELLENNFNSFVQYTSEHFGDSSETLRKHFGNSSEITQLSYYYISFLIKRQLQKMQQKR